jgi:hypothetical protein
MQMNATTSAPARQRKPRPKPQRSIRLCIKPEGTAPGIVNIRVGDERADYFLTAVPADFGRGFLVEKVGIDRDTARYHVNIDDGKRSCECKGYLRHHHCKHSDGVAALIAAGRL